jgi:serine phosphatase RsbU (regulator of sigma subunit)
MAAQTKGQPGAVTPFVIAVMLVTLYRGFAAGMLSAGLAAVAIVYFLTDPPGWVLSRQTVVAATCFTLAAVIVSVVTNRLLQARLAAEQARADADASRAESEAAVIERELALTEIQGLYQREREVAAVLQRAAFANSIPAVRAGRLQRFYLPASDVASIGGDWFDVIEHNDACLSVTVGDISGKGIFAAAEMGRLSKAIRLYLAEDPDPARALARIDQGMEAGVIEPIFATAVCATFDPGTRQLRYSCAGHPPPLHIRACGAATYLEDGRSSPLASGVCEAESALTYLAEGDGVLLYTDGLIERRSRSLDEGLALLKEHALLFCHDHASGGLDRLVEAMTADSPAEDDICILWLTPLAAVPAPR